MVLSSAAAQKPLNRAASDETEPDSGNFSAALQRPGRRPLLPGDLAVCGELHERRRRRIGVELVLRPQWLLATGGTYAVGRATMRGGPVRSIRSGSRPKVSYEQGHVHGTCDQQGNRKPCLNRSNPCAIDQRHDCSCCDSDREVSRHISLLEATRLRIRLRFWTCGSDRARAPNRFLSRFIRKEGVVI